MGVFRVIFTEHAKKDMDVIYHHYISRVDERVADKLLSEIEKAIISLASEPLLGHLPRELGSTGQDCLEILTKSFRLIYRIKNNDVILSIVLHQKQSVAKAAMGRLLH